MVYIVECQSRAFDSSVSLQKVALLRYVQVQMHTFSYKAASSVSRILVIDTLKEKYKLVVFSILFFLVELLLETNNHTDPFRGLQAGCS